MTKTYLEKQDVLDYLELEREGCNPDLAAGGDIEYASMLQGSYQILGVIIDRITQGQCMEHDAISVFQEACPHPSSYVSIWPSFDENSDKQPHDCSRCGKSWEQ